MTLTDADRKQLLENVAVAEKAVPGPWEAFDNYVKLSDNHVVEFYSRPLAGDSSPETEFIARAADPVHGLAALSQRLLDGGTTWQPIETAPKDGTRVILCVPVTNGSEPPSELVCGFYAAAGTQEMDSSTPDEMLDEAGCNLEAAWFEVSASRDPYAWICSYEPTHWMPLPPAPPSVAGEREHGK